MTRHIRRAFTILELLIVIGIIAVLIAVTLAVGDAVTTGSRNRITQDTIRVLDSALNQYIAYAGDIPAPTVDDPRPGTPNFVIPVGDVRNMSDTDSSSPINAERGKRMNNSAGLFVLQVSKSPAAKAAVDRIPGRVFKQVTTLVGGQPLTLPTPLDGWGRPIRYVHPAFQGELAGASLSNSNDFPQLPPLRPGKSYAFTDVRRNRQSVSPPTTAADIADGDGGSCTGARPYFYSAGPDGDPSTTGDNVYLTPPAFVK